MCGLIFMDVQPFILWVLGLLALYVTQGHIEEI